MSDRIAIIFDFDDTLAPDSTSGFLEYMGEDARRFWKESVDPLVEDGWDPVTAYTYRLIERSRENPRERKFTRKKFIEYGRRLTYYPGVLSLFKNLREEVRAVSLGSGAPVSLEFYIISSGLDEILQATRIRRYFTEAWGIKMLYAGDNEEIAFPKNLISFTDKTRYLFQISKGIIGERYRGKPFEVNKRLAPDRYAVPFERMIFIGDGYTDVPCFSLVKKYGGIPLGVYDKERPERWRRAWQFSEDNRVSQLASTDYRKSSDLYAVLVMAIENMCDRIAGETLP